MHYFDCMCAGYQIAQVNTVLQPEAKAESTELLEQQISEIDLNKSKGKEEEESDNPKKEEAPSGKFKKEEIEYDADSESRGKKRRFRDRLILGEADFSYTKALIKKHEIDHDRQELPSFITATELRNEETLDKTYKDFKENTDYIQGKGVRVLFGVDALNIQGCFPNAYCDRKHFERIHFNAPYMKNKQQTRDLVSGFFISASKVQNESDRVYLSLVDSNPYFWHGATYGVIDASSQAGYRLITKRKFGSVRYESYVHRETDTDSTSKNSPYLKEFVFEKTALSPDAIKAEYKALGILSESKESFGLFSFFGKNEHEHTPYDTTSDSSDYFTEEGPDQTPKKGV